MKIYDTTSLSGEEWRDIPGYEGLYQVSNLGNIISFKYGRAILRKKQIINSGYEIIILCHKGSYKGLLIHRLVMISFIGLKDGLEVNHKNGIKNDNRLSNLEWVTRSENQRHRYTIRYGGPKRKSISMFSKQGKFIKKYTSASEAGRDIGKMGSHISLAALGKQKTAYGYIWKFNL